MNINIISKQLIKILRHNKEITIIENGYVDLNVLKEKFDFKDNNIQELIKDIVNTDNKSRFGVICKNGLQKINNLTSEDIITHIRANQGHSTNIKIKMEKITKDDIKNNFLMIHGTTKKAWKKIKINGLSKMDRDYIHFTTDLNVGIRKNCKILIYINIEKVLNDNIDIYKSSNNVLLCKGIDGILLPKYFSKVIF